MLPIFPWRSPTTRCSDDVADAAILRHGRPSALAGAYERARARIPEQCAEIERAMAAIRAIEGAERNNTPALGQH